MPGRGVQALELRRGVLNSPCVRWWPCRKQDIIRIDVAKHSVHFPNGYPQYILDQTITHELGHGVDIEHHDPDDGGVTACVMRRYTVAEGLNGMAGDWHLVPKLTLFCIADDNCYGQTDVSD